MWHPEPRLVKCCYCGGCAKCLHSATFALILPMGIRSSRIMREIDTGHLSHCHCHCILTIYLNVLEWIPERIQALYWPQWEIAWCQGTESMRDECSLFISFTLKPNSLHIYYIHCNSGGTRHTIIIEAKLCVFFLAFFLITLRQSHSHHFSLCLFFPFTTTTLFFSLFYLFCVEVKKIKCHMNSYLHTLNWIKIKLRINRHD